MSTPQRGQAVPQNSPEAHRNRWRALAVTLLVGFMSLLDVTIVNVAVPSIQHGLQASSTAIQWIVSGYALTFGLTLVAGGRLGDVVGRRRMFLDRPGRLHADQCRRRPRARRASAGDRAAAPGRRGRPAHAAEQRADPAAVPGRGARPRLRPLRYDGRRLVRGGAGPRRAHHRGLRCRRRLAVGVLRQRADRARGHGARRTLAPARRAARRARSAPRSTSSARCCSGSPCWPCCCRSSRRWPSPRPRCGSWCSWRRSRRGPSCTGSDASCDAAARPCSTYGCSRRHPATHRGSSSARRTSAGSAGSGWCWRSTSRTASVSPRCSPASP